jgi:hypothetical protein
MQLRLTGVGPTPVDEILRGACAPVGPHECGGHRASQRDHARRTGIIPAQSRWLTLTIKATGDFSDAIADVGAIQKVGETPMPQRFPVRDWSAPRDAPLGCTRFPPILFLPVAVNPQAATPRRSQCATRRARDYSAAKPSGSCILNRFMSAVPPATISE